MPEGALDTFTPLDPTKFQDPFVTAKGETRASVVLSDLKTLWFNTGSLCNIACQNCYMDSGPKKDDLAYLDATHVAKYLDELTHLDLPTTEIGFTGGEPFMNAGLPTMLGDVLGRGLKALVLTNAMKPLWHMQGALLNVKERFGTQNLTLRVSVDHFTQELHERERGAKTWAPMVRGVGWLVDQGFTVDVAGRTLWNEDEAQSRAGYQALFDDWGLKLDATDASSLVLFPEMDSAHDVPEITTACWGILGVRPDAQMCASSRMVVLRKGDTEPKVAPCTLLPYDPAFEMGETLQEAQGSVQLNHPHCAKFCVLGGASCSV